MIGIFSKRLRPAFAVAATLLALGIALTFPPVQALATNFLGLFRVKQIEVVQIDPSRLSDLSNDQILGQRIGQLFSDSFTVTKEPGEPVVVADAAAASQSAAFAVRLPTSRSETPTLSVQSGTAFSLTLDRERAQGILTDAGFTDLVLPESVDGATVSVDIPASVSAAYGTCPSPAATEGEAENINYRDLFKCTIFTQMPSPTVDAPPDLDVKGLAEVGLQFIGMSAEEAKQMSETIDWSTTLVVPIPRNAADIEEVSVDGVKGTLLSRVSDDGMPARYTLIWVKDGIIYAIVGFNSPDTAIAMANSLQ